ncbi:MAG: IPTL-CTERM sorting domain-containing protein [Phycisphaerales bacterium]|nr:MAG: IPTL-CTERM sorting domain-containing protein [Phycisphaerales bacterium]
MPKVREAAFALIVTSAAWFLHVAPAHADQKRFDAHQVLKVKIVNDSQLEAILDLEAASPDFDIATDWVGIGLVDIRVSPDQKALLDAAGFRYVVTIDNVQTLIDAQRSGRAGFFQDFRTYSEYVTFLTDLAAAYPDLAELISLGTSIEGRTLWTLRITGPGTNKPGVLFHGGQHAREWLTPPIIAYAAQYLLVNYDSDPTVRQLVDNIEWFLMPIMNPDGYVYSWTTDRAWRKNRRDNPGYYEGVDLNRNWARGWGGPGSSSVPSSEIYRGPAPFSEPETQAVRNFLIDHPNVRSYIDFHTWVYMLLWPWGYTSAQTPDHDTFAEVGETMVDLVAGVHGIQYAYGTTYSTIYPVGGGSIDWVYGEQDRWAFTIEARGPFYVVPASEILPAAEENLPAMLFFAAWTAACDPYAFAAGLTMAPSAFPDCDGDGTPDVCEYTAGEGADCNGNFTPDNCDILEGYSTDCNVNEVPDECEPDCNDNGLSDSCEITVGGSADCNANWVPDECDLDPCGPPFGQCPGQGDCWDPAGNGTPGCSCSICCYVICFADPYCCDVQWDGICAYLASTEAGCDLDNVNAGSQDCNENTIPDECEADCNGNTVPDDCDLLDGTSPDCNSNAIPDECETDCNANGTPDDCDLTSGASGDCNFSGVPDECEPDGDGDGVIDECDPCPLDRPDDVDGDGVCNSDDECLFDPNKITPGQCGCGTPDDDHDGDTVPDCLDQCPGADDSAFAPGCATAIPTLSEWGLLVLSLFLLTAGKLTFRNGPVGDT